MEPMATESRKGDAWSWGGGWGVAVESVLQGEDVLEISSITGRIYSTPLNCTFKIG